ncbi:MAG TPA: ABC transporter permease, partial [Spirochaetia bacterium]|nr:ABC transporter permease [Spirochaetia bacterium]
MEPHTPAAAARQSRPLNQSIILIGLIIVICVVTAIVNPRFLRVQNLINIFQQVSILGIVACGIGMLLVAGQIDISVGTQISFMGVMLSMIVQKMMGLPDGAVPAWQAAWAIPTAILVTFAVGLAMGAINGLTVIYSRAASFIITLGFSTAYHGAALLLSGGASYMMFGKFEWLGRGRVLGVLPISILFFLGMVAITFIVLRYFRYGRFLYAIGGNKKAAFVSGIATNRVTLIAYLVVGACNALAALILISRVGSALATTGDSYALDAL